MEQIILIVHVLTALGIIALILIQQGKGADMGASFGAGASQTLFGSSGSGNALTKTTAVLATIFFATSFGLAVVAKQKAELSGVGIDLPTVIEGPAVPAAPQADAPESDIPSAEDTATDATTGSESIDIPELEGLTEDVNNSDIPE